MVLMVQHLSKKYLRTIRATGPQLFYLFMIFHIAGQYLIFFTKYTIDTSCVHMELMLSPNFINFYTSSIYCSKDRKKQLIKFLLLICVSEHKGFVL
jgi:hypothetical protein